MRSKEGIMLKKLLSLYFVFLSQSLLTSEPFVWVSILDDNINLWDIPATYSCKKLYLHALASFSQVLNGADNVHAILLYSGNDEEFRKKAQSMYNVQIINAQFSLADTPQFKLHDNYWQKSCNYVYANRCCGTYKKTWT